MVIQGAKPKTSGLSKEQLLELGAMVKADVSKSMTKAEIEKAIDRITR